MYTLEIYENTSAVNCFLRRGDAEINFDATIEIFEVCKGRGILIDFMGDDGANEHSRIAAKMHIEDVVSGRAGLNDIEIEMGYSGVSFPVTAYGAEYPIYKCENLQSVVLCILRYFLSNGYKIAHCRHCGRLYATKNLHTIYCNRNSTYNGYERYSCKDAVKRINDQLEKRRNAIRRRLYSRAMEYGYSTKHGEILESFQSKCIEYKAAIKKEASVSNLRAYSNYLQNGKGIPKRYERIKEVIR